MRHGLSIGFAMFGLGILAATPAGAGRFPRYGGDLRIQLATLPASLDPLHLAGDDGDLVGACVFEGLTCWEGGDLAPALARQWVRDEDGHRWRFTLRNEVQFHDNSRCDAAAVRQSLERLADPRQSRYAWLLSALVGWDDFVAGRARQIEGLDVAAPDQIELRFASPVPDLPARLAMPVAAIARHRADGWVGTGPFQILAATTSEVRLAAFRDHRAGRPFLDHVTFATGPEPDPGRVENDVEATRVLVSKPLPAGAVRWQAPAERLGLALVHPGSVVLGSDAVRRRLSEEFDRGVFVRTMLGGDGEPTESITPHGPKTVANRAAEPAGDLANRPREHVSILVAASEPVLRALGERLQVHLFAMDLAADLDVLGTAEYTAALAAGGYDVVVLGWTPPQPSTTALEAGTRAQLLSSGILQPALGSRMPEAWSAARLGSARDVESVLLKSRLCIPLVFFHDTWQTAAEVLDLRVGATSAALDVANVHLEAHNP